MTRAGARHYHVSCSLLMVRSSNARACDPSSGRLVHKAPQLAVNSLRRLCCCDPAMNQDTERLSPPPPPFAVRGLQQSLPASMLLIPYVNPAVHSFSESP